MCSFSQARVVVMYIALVAVMGLSGRLVQVGYCHFTTESVEGASVEVDLGRWKEHWTTVLKDWEAESCDVDGIKCTGTLPKGTYLLQ